MVGFICRVQNQLDEIKLAVIKRIHILFLKKYEGNKLRFAKAVGCDEKSIRLIFDHNQGMTLNLFFKIAAALNVEPSSLIEGLKIERTNDSDI